MAGYLQEGMAREIERKFLVIGDAWRRDAVGTPLRQGYLSVDPARSIRVRVAGSDAFLTIKGAPAGAVRDEYEYPLPLADAHELLDRHCHRPLIEKTRYRITVAGLTWEVDEFAGVNQGLVLAEVELESEDQPIECPVWIGSEVTHDPRYYNARLVVSPYSTW